MFEGTRFQAVVSPRGRCFEDFLAGFYTRSDERDDGRRVLLLPFTFGECWFLLVLWMVPAPSGLLAFRGNSS